MKTTFITIAFLVAGIHFSPAQDRDTLATKVLSEIVINGIKTEGDTLQSFYRSNPATTTETILSRMNGVSLLRRGAYGQEPVMRGLSNGQLNVTIDGMKIFGACTDKMDPVTIYIEPVNLSGIRAGSGVQGSAFGSTFGGSLDMKPVQPKTGSQALSGKTGIDFQSSANALAFYSVLNAGRKKSGYLANVTYRKSNNYHSGGRREVPFSQYEKLNIAVSGRWGLTSSDSLQADVLFDRGWKIGFPALPMDVGEATAGIYSLTYERIAPLGFLHSLKVKGYHNRISHTMDDTNRPDVAMHMDMPGKSTTSGLYAEGDVHLFHVYKTVVKVDFFSNTLLGEMTMYPNEGPAMYMQTAPEATRNDIGLYVNQEFKLDRKNKISFNFRADLADDHVHEGIGADQWEVFTGSQGNDRRDVLKTFGVNYKYKVTRNIVIDLQGGYGERMPTLNERYGFYLFNRFDGFDYLGDPGLKKESAWNAEAVLNVFSEHFEIQVAPFYKTIGDFVMGAVAPDVRPMTIGARGVKQNTNAGKAQMSGVDIMVLAKPLPSLQWITTAKYTRGVLESGEPMPMIMPLKTISTLRYDWRKINIQTEFEWSAAQNLVSRSYGEQVTQSYAILSLRSGFRVRTNITFNVGVENIFDSFYREHLDWGGILRPGRNFYGNVSFKF